MAKQRGTHQIAGKINNLVYYEQKRVRGGLIRRQNEAMSSRLKEDVVFSNTRAANSLFGACLMMSGAFLSRFANLQGVKVISSASAHLSTSFLRLYQAANGYVKDEPLNLSVFSPDELLYAFDRVFINRLDKYLPSLRRVIPFSTVSGQFDIDIHRDLLERICELSGTTRLHISLSPCTYFGPSEKDISTGKFVAPSVALGSYTPIHSWNSGDGDFSNTYNTLSGDYPYQLVELTITPVNITGRVVHRLLQYSSAGIIYLKPE